MYNGIIYKITNNITNKLYVGKTTKTAKEYWKYHKVRARGDYIDKYLYRSMRKHGIEHFVFSVITNITKDSIEELNNELSKLEIHYIKELNSKAPDGYNLTDGGEGTLGIKFTEKHRANLSKACMGRTSPRKGVKLSKKTKAKLSKAAIERYQREENPFLGKKHSKETIELIRQKNTKYQNRPDVKMQNKLKQPHRIPVEMYSLEGKFLRSFISLKETREWLLNNTNYKGDGGAIKNAIAKEKPTYGHLWKKGNKDK